MAPVESVSSVRLASSDTPSPEGMRAEDQAQNDRKVQDSLDNFIRHTMGREPYMSFPSRTNSCLPRLYRPEVLTASKIRKLDEALDVIDNAHSPPKVQLQKCQKCSREFCSEINYRRHNRTHKKIFVSDKEDWSRVRPEIGAFWERLSPKDGQALFKSLMSEDSEDYSGAKVVKALSALVQKASILSLPESYQKAGVDLLEIVESSSENFNMSAEKLFSIFDDASEKTFLIGSTYPKDQKVFSGDENVGLEDKNLVSFLGFLLEHKLLKSWMNDKDDQALICQKLLIAEEEAAQQKLAKTQEKKQKKKGKKGSK